MAKFQPSLRIFSYKSVQRELTMLPLQVSKGKNDHFTLAHIEGKIVIFSVCRQKDANLTESGAFVP